MTTGEKLQKKRKELGITQEELADKLGVSRQSISKWESDASFPETDKLIALSELYGCSLDYLLKSEKEEIKEDISEPKPKEEIEERGQRFGFLPFFIGSLIFAVIVFVFYSTPWFQTDKPIDFTYSNGQIVYIYQTLSLYNLVFANSYEGINALALSCFIIALSSPILAAWVYFGKADNLTPVVRGLNLILILLTLLTVFLAPKMKTNWSRTPWALTASIIMAAIAIVLLLPLPGQKAYEGRPKK